LQKADGRGFLQSRPVPDITMPGRSQAVGLTRSWCAAIAQLVEHVIRNDGVTGSNPVCGTNRVARFAIFQMPPNDRRDQR
jgi:hypothetical protein